MTASRFRASSPAPLGGAAGLAAAIEAVHRGHRPAVRIDAPASQPRDDRSADDLSACEVRRSTRAIMRIFGDGVGMEHGMERFERWA